ncbi:ABC transporter ATP-binding protein [Ruegeria sediminis]|uniref:ABC transporter ATP-binding protein n=1 Tax=Ruegeria sediminis TaxID=2583820 RepID=A0ABY2WT59_9RHOB|nr:ABC transporter ATP-binding protein [Ruegeria sediminis]TMV04256.1 ABC transporter ATP-binding protein [Ruegeria sediminis]
MAAAVEIQGLSCRFGGVKALDAVDIRLSPGEVLGLIGPNGSGKTSLFNLLTGHHNPEAGAILLDGLDLAGQSPSQIARFGIARTFQNLRLLRRLSVYENVRAARHACAPLRDAFWLSPAARRQERDSLMNLLDIFGLSEKAQKTPAELTLVQMRHLEIARLLAADPKLVLLDEPAAGMTSAETQAITEVIATHVLPGRSAIVIEHKMQLVAALCPRIAVLNAGRKIADGPTGQVLADSAVRQSYFGAKPC